MHSSAHDKAQRQHGVLLRRGKCVQRALHGVVTKLRTRRTLVVTAALVLLVLALLTLCHARLRSQRPAHRDGAHDNATADAVADDSTTHVAASPTDRWLLRPDAQHGGSVRVMLLMVSTRVDAPLCYALASAYFADMPVVVLGYGARPFSTSMKPSLFLDAMQRAALRDRDVVLLLDSDILFSGEDMLPFIDDYIARSPAAPSALDARAVRAGTARAPSLYVAESNCVAAHFVQRNDKCIELYEKVYKELVHYASRTGVAYDLHNASVQPLRYLNSGVSIHRVWSARELLRAYVHYVNTHKPVYETKRWRCDQSVFTLFYNELRAWEVEHDVLRNSSTAAAMQRGPHGLRAGQLQLEQTGRLAALLYDKIRSYNYLSEHAWRDDVSTASGNVVAYHSENILQYIVNAWRSYSRSVRRQQRTLTRAGNGTHTVDLTPPLLYVASRLDVARNNTRPAVLTSPLMWHVVEPVKVHRTHALMQTLPWYMPMRYNATRWQQGRAQVLSSHVELWTAANTTKRERYAVVCQRQHPFMMRHK